MEPALTWQPSLLGQEDPGPDPTFSGAERIELDDASWVDHVPAWMSGADRLFEEIVAAAPWGQRRRRMYDRVVDEPRLTAAWRCDGGEALAPPALEAARAALSERYAVVFDSAGFNLYRGGADSVAWHRDRIPAEIVDPIVALLSLGEARHFLLRPYGGGGPSRAFVMRGGDLLVTGGQTQRRWEHSVPKRASAGPRISVAYRHGAFGYPGASSG